MEAIIEISKALTWDEVADFYDDFYDVYNKSSRPARTLSMDYVFEKVKKITDCIFYNEKEGTLHKIF